jgi:hypothetical protein
MGDVALDFTATASWRPTIRTDVMAYIAAHRLSRDGQARSYEVLDPVMGAGAFLSLLTVRLNPSLDVQIHGSEAADDLYFQAVTNIAHAVTRGGRSWDGLSLEHEHPQNALDRQAAYDLVAFTPKAGSGMARDEMLRAALPRFPVLLAAGGVALLNMPSDEISYKETMVVVDEVFADHTHTMHHIDINANGKSARGLAVEMAVAPPTLSRATHSPYVDGMVLLETPLPDAYTPYFGNYS